MTEQRSHKSMKMLRDLAEIEVLYDVWHSRPRLCGPQTNGSGSGWSLQKWKCT